MAFRVPRIWHILSVAAMMLASPPRAMGAPVSEIVLDAGSGAILHSANAARVRPPASLAKMMTLLLTFEAIEAGKLRRSSRVVMTRRGARQPSSKLGLAAGEEISLQAAMKAVAVISANDVAVALAERVAGSEALFVKAMNRRARELGMTQTRFGNTTGLSPTAGRTTARDMALLARHLIVRHPVRYRIFSTRTIRWKDWVRPNHNRLLGREPGVDGVKTGYTVLAGFNLAASSRRSGRRLIVVVLGAKTAAARDLLVAKLLDTLFSSPGVRRAGVTPRGSDENVGPDGKGVRSPRADATKASLAAAQDGYQRFSPPRQAPRLP